MLDLIIAAVLTVSLLLLIAFWRVGRTILFESLSHPLRNVVLHIDQTGEVEIVDTGSGSKEAPKNDEREESSNREESNTKHKRDAHVAV